MPPRDALRQPFEGYPSYGAVHSIVPNEQLYDFFNEFHKTAIDIFSSSEEENKAIRIFNDALSAEDRFEADPRYEVELPQRPVEEFDHRKYYKVFDAERMGLTVLEMDPSASAARKVGALWQKNDLGAVEQDARNVLDRRVINHKLNVVFDRVMPVGKRLPNTHKDDVRQKLALFPSFEKSNDVHELIAEEADIVIAAIARKLKQFVYPWDVVPHSTFAVFKRPVNAGQVVELINWSNDRLSKKPVGVALDGISFRHRLTR